MKKGLFLILILPLAAFAQRLEKRLGYTAELINVGNYAEAELQLNRIISKDQGIALAYYQRSVCRFYSGYPKQAQLDAEKCIELDDDNPDYWANLGDINYVLKKDVDAIRCWSGALILDSNHTSALLGLTDFYLDHDSFKQATPLLEKLTNILGESTELHYRIALCEQGKGNLRTAISHYAICLDRNRTDELALYHITLCYYGIANWDSTLIFSEKLLELSNRDAEYYFLYGQANEYLGNKEKAIRAYEIALGIEPKNIDYQKALNGLKN